MNTLPPNPCIITMLRSPARLEPHTCNEAADEIERLRKERDEARREVCQLMRQDDYNEPFDGTVFEYAIHRGWDCFKEDQ